MHSGLLDVRTDQKIPHVCAHPMTETTGMAFRLAVSTGLFFFCVAPSAQAFHTEISRSLSPAPLSKWVLLPQSFARFGRTKEQQRRCRHSRTALGSGPTSGSDPGSENGSRPDDAWDSDVDYDKEWPEAAKSSNPDPTSAWNELSNLSDILGEDGKSALADPLSKLGIDIQLAQLTPEETAKIKKDATKIVNDAVAAGIKDIESMRAKIKRDLESNKKARDFVSEMNARKATEELQAKIDRLTSNFLEQTKATRDSTKFSAAASRSMEGTGKGLELGTWGVINGRSVVADSSAIDSKPATLLGSVDSNIRQMKSQSKTNKNQMDDSDLSLSSTVQTSSSTAAAASSSVPSSEISVDTTLRQNRIVVIADINKDKLAKQLMPRLLQEFDDCEVENLDVQVFSPTSNIPLGGNDAACVVIMCTSLSQPSAVRNILDRLLRRTLGTSGKLGIPPSQIIAVSTIGTARTEKFPYSMQNLMSGGALTQRKQIEEAVVSIVQQRTVQPPLDYTIVKVGELGKGENGFQISPEDDTDGGVSVDVVAATIVQAVAYQPFARNATMSVIGSTVPKDAEEWAEAFLPLEGPELWRRNISADINTNFVELVEYVSEWASLLATSGKGLTTPVRMVPNLASSSMPLLPSIQRQEGVRLLFLPTATGKNYVSRDEERDLENSGTRRRVPQRSNSREGGIDVVVEDIGSSTLRIRARRCNYADDAVVKELSEATIIKRLEEAVVIWERDHKN